MLRALVKDHLISQAGRVWGVRISLALRARIFSSVTAGLYVVGGGWGSSRQDVRTTNVKSIFPLRLFSISTISPALTSYSPIFLLFSSLPFTQKYMASGSLFYEVSNPAAHQPHLIFRSSSASSYFFCKRGTNPSMARASRKKNPQVSCSAGH